LPAGDLRAIAARNPRQAAVLWALLLAVLADGRWDLRATLALLAYGLDSTPLRAALDYGTLASNLMFVSWVPLLAGMLIHVHRHQAASDPSNASR
jgi:hypothetical protein